MNKQTIRQRQKTFPPEWFTDDSPRISQVEMVRVAPPAIGYNHYRDLRWECVLLQSDPWIPLAATPPRQPHSSLGIFKFRSPENITYPHQQIETCGHLHRSEERAITCRKLDHHQTILNCEEIEKDNAIKRTEEKIMEMMDEEDYDIWRVKMITMCE